MRPTLLCFGHGYCAQRLTPQLLAEGWSVLATTRDRREFSALAQSGIAALEFGSDEVDAALPRATHVLVSAAPGAEGDPVLLRHAKALRACAAKLQWVGYLSTTAVYGDHGGAWVDETTPPAPTTQRGIWRHAAETAWLDSGLPIHVFRLAGIYGPGRGPFSKLRDGTARRIIKPDQVFGRIHVEDVARILIASIAAPNPGAIYNVTDDEPAPPAEVLGFAAELAGFDLPACEEFETADLSPVARSFYEECKRVDNGRVTNELGVALAYPDYRSGLRAIAAIDGQVNGEVNGKADSDGDGNETAR